MSADWIFFCADRAADHRTQRRDPADPHPAQSAAAPGQTLLIICTDPDPDSFIGKQKKLRKDVISAEL